MALGLMAYLVSRVASGLREEILSASTPLACATLVEALDHFLNQPHDLVMRA
jgi:hypothetical protein